jgi:hypothetical protein
VKITLASKSLIEQVQIMMLNFGIVSNQSISHNKEYDRDFYTLSISGDNSIKFANLIGFTSIAKAERLSVRVNAEMNVQRRHSSDPVPGMRAVLRGVWDSLPREEQKKVKKLFDGRRAGDARNVEVTYRRLTRIIDTLIGVVPVDALRPLVDASTANYAFDKIVSLESGYAETWDVTVPGDHSFMSNGLISHNTTLARHMCISACRDGASIDFFSLENDKDYMTAGLLAMMATELLAERGLYDEMLLSDSFIIEGFLTKNQRQAVVDASREFRGFNLRILDGKSGVATVGRMAMRLRRDKFIYGTNVFIVDYLQKMRGKGTLYERVESNTHELQDLVTSEGLCGIMLAQRSEAAIKDTSADNYSIGVKGGGDPSAAADFALLTKYFPKKNPNIFGIELALARHAMPSEHAHEINPSSGLIGAEVPVQ